MTAAIGSWLGLLAETAPTELVDARPVSIVQEASGVYVVDFGRVAFGNVRLSPPDRAEGAVVVHFGEALADGRINRKPPGAVRYAQATVMLQGSSPVVAAPEADGRNTQQGNPPAIPTPPERWILQEPITGTVTLEVNVASHGQAVQCR